jgi:thiamine-phosphate pyrophosphorylase
MPSDSRLHGLYAITDSSLGGGLPLPEQVEQALQGGAQVIQYRDKGCDPARRLVEARALAACCHRHQALLLINDDLTLALASGADGVHLGRDDASIAQARQRLGPGAIIGASCYNQLRLARQARAAGADYLAFGRFFPSQTKPSTVEAAPALLRHARREFDLPLVAIGGITPENGAPLIEAGADMLAVIHAIFGQSDIQAACHAFHPLFQPEDSPT